MIVGTKAIPIDKLRGECRSIGSLRAFSLSLVPRYIQHVTEIVDNQKYLVALEVRELSDLSFARKKELCEALLEGVVLKGTINTIVDMEDVMSSINMSKVFKYMFREEIQSVQRK